MKRPPFICKNCGDIFPAEDEGNLHKHFYGCASKEEHMCADPETIRDSFRRPVSRFKKKSERGFSRMEKLIILVMVIVLGICLFNLVGCANDSATVSTLRKAGYSEIQTTGWEPFSCGEDDTYSTGFNALNPTGQKVSGVVCHGLLTKIFTIRF